MNRNMPVMTQEQIRQCNQERGPVQVTLENGMLRLLRGNPQAEGLYDPDTTNALRAFFQAERDEQLGWWRDPEEPDWIVCLPENTSNTIALLNERTLNINIWRRKAAEASRGHYSSVKVAQRYFAAHPDGEPHKPWHDAKAGEYWLVTLKGADPIPTTVGNYGENLYFTIDDDNHYCPTDDHRIQNAVRLTPEETTQS